MMTCAEVLAELERLGTAQTKKTLMRHGAPEPLFGVRIGDMQPLRKQIGKCRALANELFATGNSDAMYLAGLVADEEAMTKKDLETWLKGASWHMVSECTVAPVAAETPHGWALGRKWIESRKEAVAATGWSTLSACVSIAPNETLDVEELKSLVDRVADTIHSQANRVRYCMNSFVACVGSYVPELTDHALAAAKGIGKVEVDVGDTDCKVPSIAEMIEKVRARGSIGKKRKQVRC